MYFCSTCTGIKVCTKCSTGYLWVNGADTVCVTNCKTKGYESFNLPNKKCVTACAADDSSSIPLAGLIANLHLRCVMNCWTVDKQYLARDGLTCKNKCDEDTLATATAEYPDEWTDATKP